MGLLDRLNLLVRSELNQRRRDRDANDVDGTLAEMEAALREARRDMAQVFRDESKLEQEVDVCMREEERWEERAMRALRENNESLAREALVEQQKVARKRRDIMETLRKQRVYIADLERALEALEHKLEAARSRKRAAQSSRPSRQQQEEDARRRRQAEERRRQEEEEERRRTRDRRADSRDGERQRQRSERADSRERSRRDDEARERPRRRNYAPVSEDQRRWESMMRNSTQRARPRRDPIRTTRSSVFEAETGAFGAFEDKLQEFSRFEDKINRLEAEAEATREFDYTSNNAPEPRFEDPFYADEDDPLFDPDLARIEQQFRELERNQQFNRLKKRAQDEDDD